jgi:hypothetical protein
MIDDLYTIINRSPGSGSELGSGSGSGSSITLPIPATQLTWSDPSTGTVTIQQALQSIKSQISTLESELSSGSGTIDARNVIYTNKEDNSTFNLAQLIH